MALTPLTQYQVAENSILDVNARQAFLGNQYSLPPTGKSLTNTVETAAIVLKNPAGSGKSMFIFQRAFMTDNNSLIFRYYLNPTLNVPGSTTAAVNMRSGSANTSISLCYQGASITSNGTLVEAYPNVPYVNGTMLIIDPGNSVLITAQQAGAGTSVAYAENVWFEI